MNKTSLSSLSLLPLVLFVIKLIAAIVIFCTCSFPQFFPPNLLHHRGGFLIASQIFTLLTWWQPKCCLEFSFPWCFFPSSKIIQLQCDKAINQEAFVMLQHGSLLNSIQQIYSPEQQIFCEHFHQIFHVVNWCKYEIQMHLQGSQIHPFKVCIQDPCRCIWILYMHQSTI